MALTADHPDHDEDEGVSASTIYRRRKARGDRMGRVGVSGRPWTPQVPHDDVLAAIALIALDGASPADIEELTGVRLKTVADFIRRKGWDWDHVYEHIAWRGRLPDVLAPPPSRLCLSCKKPVPPARATDVDRRLCPTCASHYDIFHDGPV